MEAKQVRGLMEAYASVYANISESHFKVGDEVICKASGMEGEVVKLDKPDGAEDEKYYTVKREDGKTMKYAPNELKLAEKEGKEEKEEEKGEKEEKEDVKEAKNGGASKKSETSFHLNLDKLVHKTFGSSPEEKKKMKKEKGGGEEEKEKEDEKEMKEGVSYSAKKARAGEDIGKPGKMFGKIAKEAGERYGSEERGKKVAGAVLAKLRKEETELDEDANYDRNRKRAAQRAAARNEARKQGKTGVVPGVGYVSPRPERETYTDSAGVQRHKTGARMPQKEEVDLFDYILEHLVAEGYADTNQAAIAIMANMSEEWKQSILSEDPVQDFRDMRRAAENKGGARGPELSHGPDVKTAQPVKPGTPNSATIKPEPRSREFSHGGSSKPRSREFTNPPS